MGSTTYTGLWAVPGGTQALSATSSTAVGVTITAASAASALWTAPNYAFIVAETTSVRWRDDGTDPTATVGVLLPTNTGFEYDGELSKLKFISTGAQAIVTVAQYRASG